jgi:hypothetical protein
VISSFDWSVPTKILYAFLIPLVCAVCPANMKFVEFFILITIEHEGLSHKFQASVGCSFWEKLKYVYKKLRCQEIAEEVNYYLNEFKANILGQWWPASISSKAKTEICPMLRVVHKFIALIFRGNLIYSRMLLQGHKLAIRFCLARYYLY